MARIKALIDGAWHGNLAEDECVKQLLATSCGFHDRISSEDKATYPAVAGRYRLYVSYACPWAHRTIIVRHLKGLADIVPMSVLHPHWDTADGWCFAATPLSTVDHAGCRQYLHEIYTASDPGYTGRVTVPCLFDTATGRIVNNESVEIMEMLNSEFNAFSDVQLDLYPADRRAEVDALSEWIVADVCRGVYPLLQAAGETARLMCTPQTRTLATVGGNMCHPGDLAGHLQRYGVLARHPDDAGTDRAGSA